VEIEGEVDRSWEVELREKKNPRLAMGGRVKNKIMGERKRNLRHI
jgi:hypothetical protein